MQLTSPKSEANRMEMEEERSRVGVQLQRPPTGRISSCWGVCEVSVVSSSQVFNWLNEAHPRASGQSAFLRVHQFKCSLSNTITEHHRTRFNHISGNTSWPRQIDIKLTVTPVFKSFPTALSWLISQSLLISHPKCLLLTLWSLATSLAYLNIQGLTSSMPKGLSMYFLEQLFSSLSLLGPDGKMTIFPTQLHL